MIRKEVILITFYLSFFFSTIVQAQNEKETIEWSKDKKLTWEDFQGKIPNNGSHNFLAMNFGKLEFDMKYMSSNLIKVSIRNIFDKTLSWSKSENHYLLKHEQLHSDIREVYARKIRKDVSNYSYNSVRELNLYIEEVFLKWDSISNKTEGLYDEETEHSENEKKQEEWNIKIAQQLEELKEYSESEILITIKKATK